MKLTYTRHEPIRLKDHPDFTETWLQTIIAEDATVLGLGDLTLIDKERRQGPGGRLDLLLTDENDCRYEVELQLGATDERHIIRCIEYWDVERRRYPGNDHVAVLVAEDVTSRFLNVMGLFSGTIPLVVLQLNALRVGQQLVLSIVKVLDQRDLRIDDTAELGPPADRGYWLDHRGPTTLQIVDDVTALINENAPEPFELQFNKRHIALKAHGSFFNVASFAPRRAYVHVRFRLADAETARERLEEAGLEVRVRGKNKLTITLRPDDTNAHKDLLTSIVQHALREIER